eukprot:768392-Hanusia_phi.AAC.9
MRTIKGLTSVKTWGGAISMEGTRIGPPASMQRHEGRPEARDEPGRRGGVTGTAPMAAMGWRVGEPEGGVSGGRPGEARLSPPT